MLVSSGSFARWMVRSGGGNGRSGRITTISRPGSASLMDIVSESFSKASSVCRSSAPALTAAGNAARCACVTCCHSQAWRSRPRLGIENHHFHQQDDADGQPQHPGGQAAAEKLALNVAERAHGVWPSRHRDGSGGLPAGGEQIVEKGAFNVHFRGQGMLG